MTKNNDIEVRYYKGMTVERAEDGKATIMGIAAIVNAPYDMDWYDEEIAIGAFDNVLQDDVRILYNHDKNMVLARTTSNTGQIYLDEGGNLAYRYETPNRTYAKDLEDAIATGDVDQCSFAFRVKESHWVEKKDEKPKWVIDKIERLLDVGPVTYAANPATSVAKRSYDQYKEQQQVKEPKKLSLTMAIRKRQLSL
jgi:HK97 family phage prohead protease